MQSIIQAAERQLDSGTEAEQVSFRDIVGGVSKLAPKVFDWLHKAYESLQQIDASSALSRVGYSKCWRGAEGYDELWQAACENLHKLFNQQSGNDSYRKPSVRGHGARSPARI
jgi:hypothetical protein